METKRRFVDAIFFKRVALAHLWTKVNLRKMCRVAMSTGCLNYLRMCPCHSISGTFYTSVGFYARKKCRFTVALSNNRIICAATTVLSLPSIQIHDVRQIISTARLFKRVCFILYSMKTRALFRKIQIWNFQHRNCCKGKTKIGQCWATLRGDWGEWSAIFKLARLLESFFATMVHGVAFSISNH